MAPKRKAKGSASATTTTTVSPRRTRSSTTRKRVVPPPETAAPPPKKTKRGAAEETRDSKGKGKGKEKGKGKGKASFDEEPLVPPPTSGGEGGASKTIVVEACKQCNSFKTRAIKVKEGLESAVPGVSVTINPEKPRRGCFEIREDGGEVFISLLNMPRPFKPMKDLDMDKAIEDIVKKIT